MIIAAIIYEIVRCCHDIVVLMLLYVATQLKHHIDFDEIHLNMIDIHRLYMTMLIK